MAVLVVEPLPPQVLDWLGQRHAVREAPELAADWAGLRLALAGAEAAILPAAVALDAAALGSMPRLRALARLSDTAEGLDLAACRRARIEVVLAQDAGTRAEAEFVVAMVLQLLRRLPVVDHDGAWVGRELGAASVGLLGLGATAEAAATLLRAFGASLVGYDPLRPAQDPCWAQAGVEPVALGELFARSDALCVLLPWASRHEGLIGERLLALSRRDQVVVGLSHGRLFDLPALGRALACGRLAGAWLDSLEPGLMEPGMPLHGLPALQVTPRLAGCTREARLRAAWDVARRLDAVLRPGDAGLFSPGRAAGRAGPAGGSAPA